MGRNSKKFCRRFASSTCIVEKLQKHWSRFPSVPFEKIAWYFSLFAFIWNFDYCYAILVPINRVRNFGFKIQDFFQTFFQNNHLFLQNQGYQIGHQKRPSKKAGTKLLSWCGANIRARLNKIWPKRNKFTYEALSVALDKKNVRVSTIFPTLYLYFPDFFQVWKIAEQISSLFHEFKTLYEPCIK